MAQEAGTTKEIGLDDSTSTPEFELLLDYLLAHNLRFIQEFLKTHGLPYSYTKVEIRASLRGYIEERKLSIEDLVYLLDTIEGWGNQHAYLYQGHGESHQWQDEGYVRQKLREAGVPALLNRPRPLVLPETTALSSIAWSIERVRFLWVERRIWEERVEQFDKELPLKDNASHSSRQEHGELLVWKAYRRMTARGLISFDWDLVSNTAMMLIQRLPRGETYRKVRDQFMRELDPIVGFERFEPVRIAGVVRKLETSDEVRRTRFKWRSASRGLIEVTSPGDTMDVLVDDPAIERARKAVNDEATGLQGNVYWQPQPGRLSKELYMRLYGENDSDQRISIFAEHSEADVTYVLSRIRHYCD